MASPQHGWSYPNRQGAAGRSPETVSRFPPLTGGDLSDYDGVHGNAISVVKPIVRPNHERKKRLMKLVRSMPEMIKSGSPMTVRRSEDVSQTRSCCESLNRAEIVDEQVRSLQNFIGELNLRLAEKENTTEYLNSELQTSVKLEEKHKKLYEQEVEAHSETKRTVDTLQDELTQANQKLESVQSEHEKQMQDYRLEMENKLSEIEKNKQVEIDVKDKKLSRLKDQMAKSFQGSSWERQQQLDELMKELKRVNGECDSIGIRLKHAERNANNKVDKCTNCHSIQVRLNQSERLLQERNKHIQDLKVICGRFEKQPTQQEKLQKLKLLRKS